MCLIHGYLHQNSVFYVFFELKKCPVTVTYLISENFIKDLILALLAMLFSLLKLCIIKNTSRMDMMFLAHLSTKHAWVKSILVYFNEGPNIFPRGDNYKIENHWANFNQTLQKASLRKEDLS